MLMQERIKEREKTYYDKSALEKFSYIVDFFPEWIRKITMPPCE